MFSDVIDSFLITSAGYIMLLAAAEVTTSTENNFIVKKLVYAKISRYIVRMAYPEKLFIQDT